jgi:PAS domain S-box-containing protein
MSPAKVTSNSKARRPRKRFFPTLADISKGSALESALRDSEARLSAILNAEPECVKLFSPDHILEYMNPAGLSIFQADSLDQVVGTNLLDGLDPEYAVKFRELTKKVLRGGTDTMEYEITGLKGRRLRLETHAVPLRDSNGHIEHLLAVTRDITQQKAAEEALRASEQKFRALIENGRDAIALLACQGEILYCSPSTSRILGYSTDELRSMRVGEFFHPEDRPSMRRVFLAVVEKPENAAEFAARVRHKDGSLCVVEGTLTNLLNNPDVHAVVANYRDVTKRVRAERALQRAEEKFEIAFRSSPLAMSITTRSEGRFVDINNAFLFMAGYSREQILGRTSAEVGLWEKGEDHDTLMNRLSEPSSSTTMHFGLRTRTGEIRQTEISAGLIQLDEVPCVLIIARDVTESKNLERQLQLAQKMEAIGRLAGGVAHDFNNILGVIVGYTSMLTEKLAGASPLIKDLAQIERAAARGASLTRQLLAFNRQQVAFPRPLHLNALVRNIGNMLARVIGEDITFSFRPHGRVDAIRCDEGQMEQILLNLAVNARDAMPQGGQLTIETKMTEFDENTAPLHGSSAPGRYVMLSLSDTGCGMDEFTKAHLFEPFFTTKGPGKGTGLGLSTVYGIVKQNRGFISVYSEVGKGTTFKIYFPYIPHKTHPSQAREEPKKVPSGHETILLVEDELSLKSLTKKMLESGGYRVLETDKPESALRIVTEKKEHIDLLLTDVIMPGMSGAELSRRGREAVPALKVIFMSGYAGDLLDRQIAPIPDLVLVEKPFSRLALLSRVHSVIHQKPVDSVR